MPTTDHRYVHPLADFLQMEVEQQGSDAAVTRLEITDRHHNVDGVCTGRWRSRWWTSRWARSRSSTGPGDQDVAR